MLPGRFVDCLIVLLWVLVLAVPGEVRAEPRVLSVQGIRAQPYEEALAGFRETCDADLAQLILEEGFDLQERVAEVQPELLLAVGPEALARVRDLELPVVYVMVFSPSLVLTDAPNVTGVSMNFPQEAQLGLMHEAFPHAKSLGMLYDPSRTAAIAAESAEAAERVGLSIRQIAVFSSVAVRTALAALKGVDLLWLLPDLTVTRPEAVELMALFSLENQVPLIAFSDKYLKYGAAMSIGIDSRDIGRQGGEMAKRILSGVSPATIAPVPPRTAVISVNLKVADKLGLTIAEGIVRRARVVE